MKNYRLILISGLVLLSSCLNRSNNALTKVEFEGIILTEIDINKIPEEEQVINFSEIFTDFKIIPLETKKECFISYPQINFSENFIFVGTHNFPDAASLFRFDKNGKFINEIGKAGKGPGEHSGYSLRQTTINEKENTILVYWEGSSETQLFYLDGKYIGNIKRPMELMGYIYPYSENEWFSPGHNYGRPFFKKDSFQIVFYNRNGEITKSNPRINYPKSGSEGFTPYGGNNSVYKFDNSWKLYQPGVDTVYKIENKKLIPTEVFLRGKNGIPYNSIMDPNSLTGKYNLSILAETKNYLILQKAIIEKAEIEEYKPGQWTQSIYPEYKLIIIDKHSRKAKYVKLADDIFGFLTEEMVNSRLEWKNDNWIIAMLSMEYLENIKNLTSVENQPNSIKEQLAQLNNITENSNPIILSFKMKDKFRIK